MSCNTEKSRNSNKMKASESGTEYSNSEMGREQWIQHYADRIFKRWYKWRTCLGVSREYVEQLKNDLTVFYEEPLSRLFVEMSY